MFKSLLKDLITSKKFIATVAGVTYSAVGHKLGLTADEISKGVAVVVAYVVGQGIADHGKEAEKQRSRN